VSEGEVKFWRANLGCEGWREKKKRRAYRAKGRSQSNPAKISSPLFRWARTQKLIKDPAKRRESSPGMRSPRSTLKCD